MRAALDAVLAAGVERGAVPGIAAVVVDRAGARYEGASGVRRAGSSEEMTVDSVGALFSMTKALVGAAAMQLVERGVLDLDAPAGEVCPELDDVVVLCGFDADDQPITRPAASRVTLRQLLTHTSGFSYEMWDADLLRWHAVTGTPTTASGDRAALSTPLMFDPGTRWRYGIGIDWVGALIEEVTGSRLGDRLAEHLTEPLGMVDTTFHPEGPMLDRRCAMHMRAGDGALMPFDMPLAAPDGFQSGGGGMHGTMADYGRFIAMLLGDGALDGTRVLEAGTVEQMLTNQIGDLRVEPLVSCQPTVTLDAEFFPGQPKTWGLTFQLNEEPAATGRPAGTAMWAGLANSYFWIDRANGIGGASLTQVLPFADPGAFALWADVETAVYRAL